ncbi:MAG: type II toxin-antitoxin system RelE/ParE family toxin [Verrucomicrobia bacterium]|nr:type II toxin-antitoxin system RelE/ParE family toxin [Verrucomicrobiota bacterium]
MILTFACDATKAIFDGEQTPEFPPQIQSTALRKLIQINLAKQLSDLRVPPGNRLETLKGERKGQHSIRINNQWRICFHWTTAGVKEVEIVDYH